MFKESKQQNYVSFGNETFDKFLGGGLVHSSLNLFERQGPSSRLLEDVWNKSLAASTLTAGYSLVVVNFNTLVELEQDEFLKRIPQLRKVKTEQLYKDIRGKSATSQIKIAWRYSSRSSSPDSNLKMEQVDFACPISPEYSARNLNVKLFNIKEDFSMKDFFRRLDSHMKRVKAVNVIVLDLLHPFSPLKDAQQLCKFIYALRCFTRTIEKGALLLGYDTDMCPKYSEIKQFLYHMADSVVSFYSFETGQNKLTGYKHMDGTLEYVKVPKINTFGFHFQRELSDWGYRFTRNHRFFMIDELSLPPCDDDEEQNRTGKQNASDMTNIEYKRRPLKQVGPLEDFREVAQDVLAKPL